MIICRVVLILLSESTRERIFQKCVMTRSDVLCDMFAFVQQFRSNIESWNWWDTKCRVGLGVMVKFSIPPPSAHPSATADIFCSGVCQHIQYVVTSVYILWDSTCQSCTAFFSLTRQALHARAEECAEKNERIWAWKIGIRNAARHLISVFGLA